MRQSAPGRACPIDPPLARSGFYPNVGTGWYTTPWNLPIHGPSVLVVRLPDPQWTDWEVFRFITDRPGASPDGVISCGMCFPADRETHSFIYGTATSPLCPGDPFYDGYCNAELLCVIDLKATTPVESSTWGSIKALYE